MVKETENLGEEGGVAQGKGQGHETRRHITVYGNHGDTNYYFNILALACQSHLEAQDYTCRSLYAVFFCANLHINQDHMKKKKQQRKTKKNNRKWFVQFCLQESSQYYVLHISTILVGLKNLLDGMFSAVFRLTSSHLVSIVRMEDKFS